MSSAHNIDHASTKPQSRRLRLHLDCPVFHSFRVAQVEGIFDLQAADYASTEFDVPVPAVEDSWTIGLIVGPSGSGKTSVARAAFGDAIYGGGDWPANRAVIDAFGELPIKQVTLALSAVGLSSPPAWIKPFRVLSTGEKFRCDLARALLCPQPLVVMDEFSSVVDRTAARIGSAAVAKAIRSGRLNGGERTASKFVAVSCHYDVCRWLQPDWVLDMASGKLTWGRLRRPAIRLQISRVSTDAWRLFKKHHYLSGEIHPSATCFMATVEGQPAAFEAWLPFVGKLKDDRTARRGHRLVCLPDFQGVGIASALSDSNASLWAGLAYRVFYSTSHPAEMRSRLNRPRIWRMTRKPRFSRSDGSSDFAHVRRRRAMRRLIASFEYIGEAMPAAEARQCLQWQDENFQREV